ncbi:MAG: pre-16S rRNA-processing nuclease YqgF [Thainema sp.]
MSAKILLGFDPGRDKCGIAVMDTDQKLYDHQVVLSAAVIKAIQDYQRHYAIGQLIMGNQTSANQWQQRLQTELPNPPEIALVDERYSSLEARDRYWQMYPAQGLARLIPQGMRTISRPIDDIVAILLIERYLAAQSIKAGPES